MKDYDLDNNNSTQNINDKTWQDSTGSKNNTDLLNEIQTKEDQPQREENIPQLTKEEQDALNKKRNSPEFQQGLNDILPKSNPTPENPQGDPENLNALIQKWLKEVPPVDPEKGENSTGLPDKLKLGIETLSGISLDNVEVHYNSNKPDKLNALAYTQGNEIHIGPGQEEHLPHELAHIVQQKEGRVKPTGQINGMDINTDSNLEQEADVMGNKAANMNNVSNDSDLSKESNNITTQKNIMQQEGQGGSWMVPREGATEAVTTNGKAALGMAFLQFDLNNLKGQLPEGADTSNIDSFLEEIKYYVDYYSSNDVDTDGPLDSLFLSNMTTFNDDYRTVYEDGLALVRQPSLDAVRSLKKGKPMETLDDAKKDQMRAAFHSGDESGLSQLSDLISAIEEYNSKIDDWTKYLGYLGDNIRGAKTISAINKVTGNIGGALEKVGKVITAMESIGTLLDLSNQAATDSMQSINDMKATFDTIDLALSFVKAVPFFNILWDGYYKKAIDACLAGIAKIAELRSEQMHDLVELQIQTQRSNKNAPKLIGEQHFPGGQPVMDFMWQVMRKNEVAANSEVQAYFMEHESLFEAGTDSNMEVKGDSITDFWETNRIEDLWNFVYYNNRDHIWAMLYGSRLTPPR